MSYLMGLARRPLAVIHRRFLVTALPLLLAVSLVMPLTVSCQRKSSDPERGIADLRSLVEGAQGRPAPADLQRIESSYARSRAAALARFLRGYLYYTSQNYAAAVDALDARAIDEATALGDYALFYRAESEAAGDAKSQARRDFTSVYSKYPDSLKAHPARLRAAEMALALGDADGARREVARLVEADDPDAVYVAAQADEATGKTADAIKLYRKIYYELAASRASVQAEQRLAALGAAVKDNPGTLDQERARAAALLESKQFNEAAKAYTDLIARFPETAGSDAVQLRLGKALLGARQQAQAVAPLARVSEANGDVKAEALFNQAEALRRSNRAGESGVVVDRLVKRPVRLRTYPANLASHSDVPVHRKDAATSLAICVPGVEEARPGSWR